MNGGVTPTPQSCTARWLGRLAGFVTDERGVESTEIAVVVLVMAAASAGSTQALRDTVDARVEAFAERLQAIRPGE